MKKLTLKLDDLQVDSFQTTSAPKEKGTVFGEQCTCRTQCTCPGCPSCYASCNGTCDASCNGTCGASCNGTCDATCATCAASCYGTCDFSCDYSCDCSNFSCNYTCDGYATMPDNRYECVMC